MYGGDGTSLPDEHDKLNIVNNELKMKHFAIFVVCIELHRR
jgi:hypothetical protein